MYLLTWEDNMKKNNDSTWKEKAVARQKEIKALKKEAKRLSASRDQWKNKASAYKETLKKNF